LNASALELVGMLAACGAAAAALVLDDRPARSAAMIVALTAAPLLVAGNVWSEPRVADFRSSPAQVAAAVVVGGAALALLATLFRRHPSSFAIAAFAVLPLRIPIDIGGETANLLVPLYLVIAAGVLARASTDRRAAADGPRPARADRWSQRLRWVLAAGLVLYAIQASYSVDVSNAIENIGFFLTPFAILFALLVEVEWTRSLLRRVVTAVGIVAAGCAAIGIYQYFARDLFLNPELFDANELHVYFRVNSIFFDPNILGRYLALAITALAACIAWGGSRRDLTGACVAVGLALVGLAFSYSITSFGALLAGLGIVAVLRWGLRGAIGFGAIGAVALVVLLIAGGTPNSDIQSDRSIDSGHADLIKGGIDLAQDRPIAGYGSGSFGRAFFDQIEQARTTVSHSEPITVAAEQGAIGLILYAVLLVVALFTMLGDGAGASLARAAAAACFVTILVDSLGYTGFTTDPATWALLGLGVALRRDPPEASATIQVT
jgi:putative inorganic carbon (hco3(-)) transporter